MLNKLGKCSKKTPRINQIIIPFLPTVWILGFQMTNLNNVEPWLAQAEPVSAQFPTSLGLTSYNLFLVNHRTKIIHQSAQHANTIMRISKQQMKPLLPSTNWIHNWMTKTDTHATFWRHDDQWRGRQKNSSMILFSVFTLAGDPWLDMADTRQSIHSEWHLTQQ